MVEDTHQVSPLLYQELPLKTPMYQSGSKSSQNNVSSIREVCPSEGAESFWDRLLGFREHGILFGFATPLLTSSLLLVSHLNGWVLPARYQIFITRDRATTQIIVQVLASILGFLQFAPICAVINRATRLSLSRRAASLDDLRFWSLLCSRTLGWDLPANKLILLLLFLFIGLNPAAIWAGALTPISVYTTRLETLRVPGYSNISMIKEYPSEFGAAGADTEVRNTKGVFSYLGITFEGALLSTAASATTVDGSPRLHNKLDNSGLIYNGRSYGVGSPAGLTDAEITNNVFAVGYTYQEAGYKADVDCIYNASSQFVLQLQDSDPLIVWEAIGTLPNSNGQQEVSTYFGRNNGAAIVAIGVAAIQTKGTQYLGIAAGQDYASLNQTQCSVDFIPTTFNVTVFRSSTAGGNITVSPISNGDDIDPSGNITHASIRQLELISNDQTNLYQSLLGNSFMASIGDYVVSQPDSPASNATLSGLQNSVAAMLDDILSAYASAQLIVGNQSVLAGAKVEVQSLQVGQRIYVFAEVGLNILVLMVLVAEAVRTRGWKGLGGWDYMDIRCLIISLRKGVGKWGRGGRKSVSGVGGEKEGEIRLRFQGENRALVFESPGEKAMTVF